MHKNKPDKALDPAMFQQTLLKQEEVVSVWLWIQLLFLLASITLNCSVRTHYQRKPAFDDGHLTALTVSGSAQKQDKSSRAGSLY